MAAETVPAGQPLRSLRRRPPRPGGRGSRDNPAARYIYQLTSAISEWADGWPDRVARCDLALHLDHAELIVVGKSERFDVELNAALAEFAVEMATEGYPLVAVLYPSGTSLGRSSQGGWAMQYTPEG